MKFLINILNSLKTIIVTVIVSFIIIFMVSNREIVAINFSPLPIEAVEIRVFLLILIFYVLGLLTASLIFSSSLIRKTFKNFKQKRQIRKLQDQINEKL